MGIRTPREAALNRIAGNAPQPDLYQGWEFDPVPYSEYPKAIYPEAPHLTGTIKVEGLDHLEHTQPVMVDTPEDEAEVWRQNDEWKAAEAERKAREEAEKPNKLTKGG